MQILKFLIALGVLLTAVLFVNAGILYIFSPSNASNVARAHKIFTNTFIGIIIILAAWLLIDTVMKALVSPASNWGPWNTFLCTGNTETRTYCIDRQGTATLGTATPQRTEFTPPPKIADTKPSLILPPLPVGTTTPAPTTRFTVGTTPPSWASWNPIQPVPPPPVPTPIASVVTIVGPYAGSIVAGTISVVVQVTGNSTITGVLVTIDGNPLGDDTAAPYTLTFDTTSVADGQHTLVATARDNTGKTTASAPVTITIHNSLTPLPDPTPNPNPNPTPNPTPIASCDDPVPAPTNSTVVTVQASNGSDDTAVINAAIASVPVGGTVRVPAGTYLINALTSVRINKSLTFKMEPGAILKAKPNASGGYNVLLVTGSNVNIIGGTLQGERNQHLTPGNIAKLVPPSPSNPSCLSERNCYGQWGHGLELRGSTNVFVSGVLSKDMWGDGFNASANAKNSTFCSVTASNNRRQGMSIINASGVIVKNSLFTNTVGHPPQCGFDVEPNANQIASNIKLLNSQFTNNENCGLSIYAGAPGSVVSGLTITGNTATGNRGNAKYGYILDNRAIGTVFTNNTGQGTVYIGGGTPAP